MSTQQQMHSFLCSLTSAIQRGARVGCADDGWAAGAACPKQQPAGALADSAPTRAPRAAAAAGEHPMSLASVLFVLYLLGHSTWAEGLAAELQAGTQRSVHGPAS